MKQKNIEDNYTNHPAYDLFKSYCSDMGKIDNVSNFSEFLDALQIASMLLEQMKIKCKHETIEK